jgi:thioredoxin-related protein
VNIFSVLGVILSGSIRKFVWRACAILLVSSVVINAAIAASPGRDPLQYFFHQSFGDLREEAETARAEGKLGVLIMFDDPDCPWCHKMMTTILNQVEVQEYFRKYFRMVKIDTRGDAPVVDFDGAEMLQKDYAFKVHRVRATPVFVFFDAQGNKIMRFTGTARSVDEFLWLGEFVVDGHYKTKKFSVYKREKRAALRN